jgi:flagellar FliJ protein
VKRFGFRFERVFETKRYFEEMKRTELAALMAQRLQDEQRLLAVQGTLLERQCELAGRAEARQVISDIARLARYMNKLADDIRRIREQLARWDEQIESKRDELVEAKRETKILEKLKASDRRAYDKALSDWEQKLIDEAAAGRYVRGVRGEVH